MHLFQNENDENQGKTSITDLRQKLDERKKQLNAIEDNNSKKDEETNNHKGSTSQNSSPNHVVIIDVPDKKNDEDALDFEAEEGECNDTVAEEQNEAKVIIKLKL